MPTRQQHNAAAAQGKCCAICGTAVTNSGCPVPAGTQLVCTGCYGTTLEEHVNRKMQALAKHMIRRGGNT